MKEVFEYVTFSKSEKRLMIKATIIFTLLYTAQATLISQMQWYTVIIPVFLWYLLFVIAQLVIHKISAYYQAFTLHFEEMQFDRFNLEEHATLTKRGHLKHPIEYSTLSIFLAIFTIGFLVFPSIFGYTHRKIDHLFFGKRKLFEYKQGNLYPQENTHIRQSYALFFTYLYPVALILIFSLFKQYQIIYTLLIITVSHSIISLLPLFPHQGYKYFSMHFYLWMASFTLILIFGLFALFFTSFISFITVSLCASMLCLSIFFIQFTNGDNLSGT